LHDNKDLFAWIAPDMPGVNPSFGFHQLSDQKGFKLVDQKKRKMGPERVAAIEVQVKELLEARFICKIQYVVCLSNVVMVKKTNGK
jgi:hypothetical protein